MYDSCKGVKKIVKNENVKDVKDGIKVSLPPAVAFRYFRSSSFRRPNSRGHRLRSSFPPGKSRRFEQARQRNLSVTVDCDRCCIEKV